MHQQIGGSSGDTADNIRRIVHVLAKAGVNIEAIAPAFDSPHVRVVVVHFDPYDPTNGEDPFNQALAAMEAEGMAPQIKPSVLVSMPNTAGALKAALDRLSREGYAAESVLVLPGLDADGRAQVSFGVARTTIPDWDAESSRLEFVIGDAANQAAAG